MTLPLTKLSRREEDGAPKSPLTLKVTLLNPVVMLPQDDENADSKALFLQGLVMANYVRSPRYEKSPQQLNSAGAGSGKEGAAAEARETSLEVKTSNYAMLDFLSRRQ